MHNIYNPKESHVALDLKKKRGEEKQNYWVTLHYLETYNTIIINYCNEQYKQYGYNKDPTKFL